MATQVTRRQAWLLALVVREYVDTAQPVASERLVREHELGLSSATIRNELAALEGLGLLTHAHTSAGRQPTASGYRYFVEHLMETSRLAEGEQHTIRHQFHQAGADIERWWRLAAAVMAQASRLAGLVEVLRRADGTVAPRVYQAGLIHMVDVPEFADAIRLKGVLDILEHGLEPEGLLTGLPEDGVHVIIGGEPPLDDVPEVTLVLSRFGAPGTQAGVLGIVGPTRLPYERAVPTVGFVARLMTGILARREVAA
jgi:transcriptional regulator of heat shock response